MKQTTKSILAMLMCIIAVFTFASCGGKQNEENNNGATSSLWDNAVLTADTQIGEGEKMFQLKITAEDKSIVLTINTDKDFVGEPLKEYNIISGEDGPFGIFISHVNGIKAVYEEDGAYWGFKKDGEMLNSGVDTTEIEIGAMYELVYTKA